MFHKNEQIEMEYTNHMESIKALNYDWICLRKSPQYKIGMVIFEILRDLKKKKIGMLFHQLKKWSRAKKFKNRILACPNNAVKSKSPNYFSNDRIVVYTGIFGGYDKVIEPFVRPDNIDYVLITDDLDRDDTNSAWKNMHLPGEYKELSNIEKNRFVKMNPHRLFPNYKYSIYIDGNIQVMTDLTEYVNKIANSGIGVHLHASRNCVYDEIDQIRKQKRDTIQSLEKHKAYLESAGMPKNYGLCQCNVIAREHMNIKCIKVMEQWWSEFQIYSKRDQVSFPHVLYMNGIEISEVATLGSDFYSNPSFRICSHI